jgi:hypothetical protein
MARAVEALELVDDIRFAFLNFAIGFFLDFGLTDGNTRWEILRRVGNVEVRTLIELDDQPSQHMTTSSTFAPISPLEPL